MLPVLVAVDIEPASPGQGLTNLLVWIANDFVTQLPVLLGFIGQVLGFAGNCDYVTTCGVNSIKQSVCFVAS